jgi:hypothetical protein
MFEVGVFVSEGTIAGFALEVQLGLNPVCFRCRTVILIFHVVLIYQGKFEPIFLLQNKKDKRKILYANLNKYSTKNIICVTKTQTKNCTIKNWKARY